MALEDIFRALEEQGREESDEILRNAREQAQAISDEATDYADKLRADRVADAEQATRLKAAKSLNKARLESKKRVAAVKEAAVEAVIEAARDELGSLRGAKDYAAMFRALTEEAIAGVDGDITLLVDPADEELARSTIKELGVDAGLQTTLSTRGGVVVAAYGGKVMRRNTFEDRLEKVAGITQADVAEILFS